MTSINAPDLTQRPPRSPYVRLGGWVSLPRMLDKGRASIIGKNGEYHYNCPLDQRLLSFLGLDAEALKTELATGKGDGEILEWIEKNAKNQRTAYDAYTWSAWASQRAPGDNESREYFSGILAKVSPTREDIATWYDLLDTDDFASFGGKA